MLIYIIVHQIALIHHVGYVRYQRTFYYYYKIISFVNFYSHECILQLENVFAIVGKFGHKMGG